jgi:hypothetical protein
LKNCQKVRVGVRIKDANEWLEVGRVKSEKDEFTEVAVARQRALIAEVSFLMAMLRQFIHDNMYLIV